MSEARKSGVSAAKLAHAGSSVYTSESTTEGHPDKVGDRISDATVDAAMDQDPNSRMAIETMVSTNRVFIVGEMRTEAEIDIEAIARKAIRDVGYSGFDPKFDADTVEVIVEVDQQSPDIAQGVDAAAEAREDGSLDEFDREGAGDQGMMYGHASDETPTLMPAPIDMAHRMAKLLAEKRKDGTFPWAGPDGKTQVSVRYEDGRPVATERVLISTQHVAEADRERDIRPALIEHVVKQVVPEELLGPDRIEEIVMVNPTGRFVAGGPAADAGLTGRKLMVDTYGGMARHGGGAFSGKDPSKVDRSGAYKARHVAKNVVAAGLAKRCEVQIAYAIGVATPVSLAVECFGTERVPVARIGAAIKSEFDLRPLAYRRELDLHRPIYTMTSAYGHFGRELPEFTWERTDRADDLARAAGLDDPFAQAA
jgi:S-adenosylmethionine synthetase